MQKVAWKVHQVSMDDDSILKPESAGNKTDVCPICLEQPKVRGIMSGCNHICCFECILKWAKETNKCPVCKRRFTKVTKSSKTNDLKPQQRRGRKRSRSEQHVLVRHKNIVECAPMVYTHPNGGRYIHFPAGMTLGHQQQPRQGFLGRQIRARSDFDVTMAQRASIMQQQYYPQRRTTYMPQPQVAYVSYPFYMPQQMRRPTRRVEMSMNDLLQSIASPRRPTPSYCAPHPYPVNNTFPLSYLE